VTLRGFGQGEIDEPSAALCASMRSIVDEVALSATDSQPLDQLSHGFPQLGYYRLLEPRMFSRPNYAAPTWMRQREELWGVLGKCLDGLRH
jgi:hypothetical protein